MTVQEQPPFSGRTAWVRGRERVVRRLFRTDAGSALVLIAAALAALVWINVDRSSYEGVWRSRLAIDIGPWGLGQEVIQWVNTGLMTFFFFVVGLEVRRELDIGDLRRRERVAVPVLAGIGGMVAAVT